MIDNFFEDQIFLLSSFRRDEPEALFHGYCFVGTDYVYGPRGASRWETENNQKIPSGEDGCYAVVRRRGSQLDIGTDAAGNKKVFYFYRSGVWAVSNSLHVLVKHLQANKIVVLANTTQLLFAGYGRGPYSFLNQLVSFDTPFQGIRLLPCGWQLSIGPDGVKLSPVEKRGIGGTYENLLEHFIGLWVGRLTTLISSDRFIVTCDLTGGQDSRAVFSLLHRATVERGGVDANMKIKCGLSRGGDATDLNVAARICEKTGFELNGRVPRSPRRFNAAESYQSWKDLCLGAYWPVYFPSSRPWPWRVALGGGGGENFRSFYTPENLDRYIERISSRVGSPWHSRLLRLELVQTISSISDVALDDSAPLIAHYRQFRNRFHSGRTSQYFVSFSPLMSSWLEAAGSAAGGSAKIAGGIVNYDIIYNSSPELLGEAFDNPAKNFDERKRGLVSDLNFELAGQTAGKSFIDESEPKVTCPSGGATALELFAGEFQEAARSRIVQSLWGKKFLEDVSVGLQQAVANKRLGHAIDGQAGAAVLASALF